MEPLLSLNSPAVATSNPTSHALIEMRDVSKSFGEESAAPILSELNLSIRRGEFVSIVGPSGAGKSTILNLAGLLSFPTSGDVYFDGHRVQDLSDREIDRLRGRRIGFVFQESHMIPERTVAENLAVGLLEQGFTRAEVEQRIDDALALVDLVSKSNTRASSLSGGERQRAAIARAVASQPELILADEPTGSLDQGNGRRVMEYLRHVSEQGITVVIITHDPLVAQVADRTITVVDGRVADEQWNHDGAKADSTLVKPFLSTDPRRNAPLRDKWFNRLSNSLRDALASTILKPLRSVFLIGAILVGVVGLVAATGISQTAALQIADRISTSGLDEVRVGAPGDVEWTKALAGIQAVIDVGRVASLDRTTWEPHAFSPTKVSGAPESISYALGVDPGYFRVQEIKTMPRNAGAVLSRSQRATILGVRVAEKLGIHNADGSRGVWMNGHRYAVIGVAHNSAREPSAEDAIFVPFSASLVANSHYIVRTEPGYPAAISDAIPRTLDPAHPERISVSTVADLRSLSVGVSRDLGATITVISSMLLIVAILGCAASMSLAVHQRTGEIGLRRALGATRRDVVRLFFCEGLIVGFAGGMLGVSLGNLCVAAVSFFQGWAMTLSPATIGVGLLTGTLCGALASVIPALLAARLDPSEAVRKP